MYRLSRLSAFLLARVLLHKPITIDINSTARGACIRTVFRDTLIAFTLGV
jgi:hypothetical protein